MGKEDQRQKAIMLIDRISRTREQVAAMSEMMRSDVDNVRMAIAAGEGTGDRMEDFIYYCSGYLDDLEILPLLDGEELGPSSDERRQFTANCRTIARELDGRSGQPVCFTRGSYARPNEIAHSGMYSVTVLYRYDLGILDDPPLDFDFGRRVITVRMNESRAMYTKTDWTQIDGNLDLDVGDLIYMKDQGLKTLTINKDGDETEKERLLATKANHLIAGTAAVEMLFSVGYAAFFSRRDYDEAAVDRIVSNSGTLDRSYFDGARMIGLEPSADFKRRYVKFLMRRRPELLTELYAGRDHRETVLRLITEALKIDLHNSPIELEVEPGVRVRADRFVHHLCGRYDILIQDPPQPQ